jgi:NADPH:quinone reductase-like Zn-dependent oxidoreductase
MGFEGSGVVVESGGGVMGWSLKNKKVAFGASKEGIGSYAQYVVSKVE